MPARRESNHPHLLPVPLRLIEQLSEKRQEMIRPVLEVLEKFVLLNVLIHGPPSGDSANHDCSHCAGFGIKTYKDFSTISTTCQSLVQRFWTVCRLPATQPSPLNSSGIEKAD